MPTSTRHRTALPICCAGSAWFAVTFWLYLETRSVLATSVMAGVYLVITSVSGFFLGSIVDRYRKWAVLAMSSLLSLGLYLVAPPLALAWVFGALVNDLGHLALDL